MSVQARIVLSGLLLVVPGVTLRAQLPPPSTAAAELQQHYDAAQHYQQAGDLDRAAREYQQFLSQTLDEVAVGEAHLGSFAKAAPLFEQANSLNPESVRAHLDYAQAELRSGEVDKAEHLAREALQIPGASSEETARAHEVLGRILLKMNRDQEARKELEAAAAMQPSFDHSYNLAIACLDLDDAPCATRIFDAMEKTYGDTPGIHMDFGRAWGQSDFQPRAEEEFRKAIEEDPKLPAAHYSLAATYLQENANDNIREAQGELQKELTVSPDDYLTYAALGKLAASQQRYAEAERCLRRAIQINPKLPDAWLYLGQMEFDTSHGGEAESALRKAILLTADPSRNRYQIQKAYYLLGRLLMRQGKEKEASAEMKIAQSFLQNNLTQDRSKLGGLLGSQGSGMADAGSTVALSGASADATVAASPEEIRKFNLFRKQVALPIADSYNNLGAIAAVKKAFGTAASYFKEAADWNPAMEGIDLNRGRAAFSAALYGEAIPPLTRYLHAHPAEQNIRAVLGISQYMAGDYAGCVATLRPVQPSIRSVAQVAFVYADSLVKTGQVHAGEAMLKALEEKSPEIPDVHRALGEAYAQAKEQQQAVAELREALRLNPQDQRASADLDRLLPGQRGLAGVGVGSSSGAAPQARPH